MKRFLNHLWVLLVMAVLLGGCLRLTAPENAKQAPAPAQMPTQVRVEVPESAPLSTPPEEIAVPYTVPEPENPNEGLFIIDPNEPQEYLGIEKMRLQRISRDRGELKKITLVFRNIGPGELLEPTVRFTFSKADVKGNEATVEQDFPLPNIPVGMKLVKEFPVSVLFSNIDRDKTITLKFYKKFESPRKYYGTHIKVFKPIDEFEDLEIKWL